jgi:hypothetical protein
MHDAPLREPPLQVMPQSEEERQETPLRGPPTQAVPQLDVETQLVPLCGPPAQAVPQSELERQLVPLRGPPEQVPANVGAAARTRRTTVRKGSRVRIFELFILHLLFAS